MQKNRFGAGWPLLSVLFVVLSCLGCGKGGGTGTTDPEEKLRLGTLVDVYKQYTATTGKAPADEKALRDYLQKMSKEDRAAMGVPDDLDSLFVSPRDQQKYVVRYGVQLDPADNEQALAWEKNGKDGKRVVAMAYGVKEVEEAEFKTLKKQ